MKKAFLLLFLGFGVIFTISAQNTKKLTKSEADDITRQLIEVRHQNSIKLFGDEWRNNLLWNGADSMKFSYKVFGQKPINGRALYISMHGGGGAPKEVNDGQWENQKRLYTPKEGVYFVPRAPSDTWDMWHQKYMDHFIEKIIELAVINEGVNPNKVYVMGYSAGGDGTYQLAPRLADLWAAAAMSAGHPGDAQIENLRNLPFAIYMGGKDTPYHRNDLARAWKLKHDSLSSANPLSYIHDIHIFEQYKHWMNREDSISMSWMPQFYRNPIPETVTWIQDDVIRERFYWLQATEARKQGDRVVASYYANGHIDITECTSPSIIICLNDAMVNLDKPVEVFYQGKCIFEGIVPRKESNIKSDVDAYRDTELVFPVKLKVVNNSVQIL
ncbi:MAG: dienelactone hydrolase family protein [Mucinivorans sp.]